MSNTMAKKNTLIVVKGKRWVVEGDNYAGFRDEKQWNFFDVKEYSEFMQEAAGDTNIIIKSIETFTITPDKVLDVKLQLQLAAEKKEDEKKAERKRRAAELRAEARRIERENGY